MATTTGQEGIEKPPEQMRHVDLRKDNVTPEQRAHMNKMEEHIQKKARQMKKVGRKNAGVAIGLGIAVVGISVTYSIWSVGREQFLDNFDDPNKSKEL